MKNRLLRRPIFLCFGGENREKGKKNRQNGATNRKNEKNKISLTEMLDD